MIKRHLNLLVTLIIALYVLSGCDKIDNDRISPYPVYLTFNTIGDWELYGVAGAGEYKRFIYTDTEQTPANYPYKGLDKTGFGGLLLVCDPNGEYLVYDLACPVEAKRDVRISIDATNPLAGIAKCSKCGSTYDLYSLGTPASGEALSKKYGLQRYHIQVGSASTPYAIITR